MSWLLQVQQFDLSFLLQKMILCQNEGKALDNVVVLLYKEKYVLRQHATELILGFLMWRNKKDLVFYHFHKDSKQGAAAYQLGNTSSRTITEVKQR